MVIKYKYQAKLPTKPRMEEKCRLQLTSKMRKQTKALNNNNNVKLYTSKIDYNLISYASHKFFKKIKKSED